MDEKPICINILAQLILTCHFYLWNKLLCLANSYSQQRCYGFIQSSPKLMCAITHHSSQRWVLHDAAIQTGDISGCHVASGHTVCCYTVGPDALTHHWFSTVLHRWRSTHSVAYLPVWDVLSTSFDISEESWL